MNLDKKRKIQLSMGVTFFIFAVAISYFFAISDETEVTKHDIYMVLDTSGSMEGSSMTAAKNAAHEFVNKLQLSSSSDFRVGLIEFESYVRTVIDLTYDQNKLHTAISELQIGNQTAMGEAILVATEKLSNEGRLDAQKTILLLTDGKSNGDVLPSNAARTANDNDVSIFSVGYGSEADTLTLNRISDITGGKSYEAITGQELVSAFSDIANTIISPVVQYGSRTLILFAIPIMLFIPAIEKGLTNIIGRKETIPSCSKCGFLNKSSSKFCGKCGNPMRRT